ncbi:hypothetical protein HK405_015965, partial [Cladochytrium tenue]
VDPRRVWKGVWRWFDETHLDCTPPLDAVRRAGLTFDDFACLARCNGLDVVARRPAAPSDDDNAAAASRAQFAADLRSVACGSGAVLMVVAFSRAALGQSGDGHYSPVGAYHAAEDKVLVMDVAAFKYPPFFVAADRLFDAMLPVDRETGAPRGYYLLQKANDETSLVQVTPPASRTTIQLLLEDLPRSLRGLTNSDGSGFGLDTIMRHVVNKALHFNTAPHALADVRTSTTDRITIAFKRSQPAPAPTHELSTSGNGQSSADIEDVVEEARRCAPALFRAARTAVALPSASDGDHAAALTVLFLAALPERVVSSDVLGGSGDGWRELAAGRRAVASSLVLRREVERLAVRVLRVESVKCGWQQACTTAV